MYNKPWETVQQKTKRVKQQAADSAQAKRKFSRSIINDTRRRLDKDTAMALAREFVKHGDMERALVAVGLVDEDASTSVVNDIARRARRSANFANAFDYVVTHFDEHEILTRDRILAGLFMEASDRYGPTSGASRVGAWAKLAMLTGMEAEAKHAEEKASTDAVGGVLLIPFSASVEQWEADAMGQQAKLKSDVRN